MLQLSAYNIDSGHPRDWPEKDLSRFIELVDAGGEVAAGVRQRVLNSLGLVVARFGDEIVGTSAVKRPNAHYKKSVFEKAGIAELAQRYELEIGWVYVEADHRRQRLSTFMIERAIELIGASPAFATVREGNEGMRHILEQAGLRASGEPYAGRGDRKLLVYLKGA